MPVDAARSMPEPTLEEIETSIQELEELLTELRDRYEQVKVDEPLRSQLKDQVAAHKKALKTTPKASLKADLAKLSDQLDEVEMRLESRLVSWLGLREYFWQISRFGGIGVLIGWSLTTWMMNDRPLPNVERSPSRLEQPK
jgi:hypothetical protein